MRGTRAKQLRRMAKQMEMRPNSYRRLKRMWNHNPENQKAIRFLCQRATGSTLEEL